MDYKKNKIVEYGMNYKKIKIGGNMVWIINYYLSKDLRTHKKIAFFQKHKQD